ncbi:MAG TPA: [Fe-Fe] hydrogenase large subunit C-terminal domain-containing protein [Bacteroidales bacterium]|nr:[Fe-Fe] hydrogenase large subunit C-terminal domain-containing protein [Bacteroidales bacterium]
MGHSHRTQLVYTVKDRCRVCYTCVRECPVKAIKIINGQAEVLNERCIGCGNCVQVCSQDAKVFVRSTQEVEDLLNTREKVIACVAPSFPAEFTEINDYRILVGMLRQLGFSQVTEIAFGADMVAREYDKIMRDPQQRPTISSDCPAIVFFIEHYYPELVPALAPVASPMVAMARIVRERYGHDSAVVFIGPCIAKKAESDEIDEALTFVELRQMFEDKGIGPETAIPSEFDPPHAGKGAIFPISRGLLQTINRTEDVMEGNVLVAEGRVNFREAIKEFHNGLLDSQHLELLCCDGCIMGPGMSPNGRHFSRRKRVTEYVKQKLQSQEQQGWEEEVHKMEHVPLEQEFHPLDRRIHQPQPDEIIEVLHSMGKTSPRDHLNCGACGYDTCYEHAVAVVQGLAENEMCLPFTIEKLHHSIEELNISNDNLASAREALKQSEKLAHMGQLSAGIAHELNNPLGVITMYSNLLIDEAPEGDPVRKDLELIVEQAARCKKIVGGLLNFARKNQVNRTETNLLHLVKAAVDAIHVPQHITVNIRNKIMNPVIMLDRDQMLQVLINLGKNAMDAMTDGGILNIILSETRTDCAISLQDTGTGISKENMEKIFTPFFTTKGPGKGTGLGLPIIYGIVKMHQGKIDVHSNADPETGPTGTNFTIILPKIIETESVT